MKGYRSMITRSSPSSKSLSPSGGALHVVGVGAAAGGLESLEELFRVVPADSGMAFVVIQHLSPDGTSHVVERLARQTAIPVHRVEHGRRVEPNEIYLLAANKEMVISEGRFLLTERSADRSWRLPIDRFFRSLANQCGRCAIGVILSGTGRDGSRGVQDIHDAGGFVIAQDQTTAKFGAMPRNAIATGKVDVVLAPPAIAAALVRHANLVRYSTAGGPCETLPKKDLAFETMAGPDPIRMRCDRPRARPRAFGPQPVVLDNAPDDRDLLRAFEIILSKQLTPSILLNDSGEILRVFGGAQRFLKKRCGRQSNRILDAIHDSLRGPLSIALHPSASPQKMVRRITSAFHGGDDPESLRISVEPIGDSSLSKPSVLIEFSVIRSATAPTKAYDSENLHVHDKQPSRVDTLESELRRSQEHLRSTIEELAEAKADMDNLLATTAAAVIFLDDQFCIRRFTPEIARVLRLQPQDTGRPIENFVSNLNRPDLIDDLHEVRRFRATKELRVKDRSGHPYLLRIVPYRVVDKSGGLVMTLIDNKRLTDAEAEIGIQQMAMETANEAAKIAHETKSAFLAMMSHELRTPLTAVLGFADMLKSESTDPEYLEKVDTIKRNGTYLLALLKDILELSEVEAGKLRFVREDIPIRTMMAEVESLMQIRAGELRVPLRFEFGGHLPENIQADATRVRQILVNLISNALKFGDSGEVVVSTFTSVEEETQCLKISVRDFGIGISKNQLAELFTPFNQADPPTKVGCGGTGPGGTGLGLSISKRFAEAIGGVIDVDSELGQGSCFTLSLPIEPTGGKRLEIDTPPFSRTFQNNREEVSDLAFPSINGKILLADDRRDIWRVGKYFLEKCGAAVTVVENGKQAVEAVIEAASENAPFSLVLMDMQMPIMTGHEAVRELRRLGFELPIIALTADAMQGEREACIKMGCNGYFPKPIDGPRLMNSIASFIRQPQ